MTAKVADVRNRNFVTIVFAGLIAFSGAGLLGAEIRPGKRQRVRRHSRCS